MNRDVSGSASPVAIGPASRASTGLSASSSSPISMRMIVRDQERGRPKAASEKIVGGDLLSREDALRVPSARGGLTSLFGTGRGVPPPLSPPKLSKERANARPSKLHSSDNEFKIKTSGN